MSACAIYGDGEVVPSAETALPGPLSPYAVSKLIVVHFYAVAANLRGLVTISLRYVQVFGLGQELTSIYTTMIPRFAETTLAEGASSVAYRNGEQTRDLNFVEDVVAAKLLAETVA